MRGAPRPGRFAAADPFPRRDSARGARDRPPPHEVAGTGVRAYAERVTKPGNAAVLSLIVPGVGQIYNGDFLRGIFWLIITPGFWIGSGGLLGWVCHLIAAYTAHRRATRYDLLE